MPNPWASTVLGEGKPSVSQYRPKVPAVGGTDPERLTPQAQDVGDIPTRLQPGYLSCRTCGIGVRSDADDVITVKTSVFADAEDSAPVSPQNPLRLREDSTRRTTVRFALCPLCRAADSLAEELSGDPATRNPYARALLGGAFDALLFVAPRPIETGEVAKLDDLSMRSLVRHLGQLGAQARWMNRAGANHEFCARYAFAHLKIGQRHQLRDGFALWLKERASRNAPPVKISPPPVTDNRSGSAPLVLIQAACLICGIATQTVSAATVAQMGRLQVARQIWEPLRTSAASLGASSAVEVSGFVCKVCSSAVDATHSVGPSALERCLVAHLCPDLVGKLDGWSQVTMSGLEGWSALVARAHRGDSPNPSAPRPNAAPWEHLGDLGAVRKQLRRRLG